MTSSKVSNENWIKKNPNYFKDYYNRRKTEYYQCDKCNCTVSYSHMSRHMKTKKHIRNTETTD